MVHEQESSVQKAQGSGHMDIGETKAEPAAAGTCGMTFAVLDKLPGHSHWEDKPEQLCTWAEKWDIESHVSGWASSDLPTCPLTIHRGF